MELELIRKEDKEIVEKAEKFFEPLHRGHSHFQIEHFILNDEDFPLPDDKYYQAMLETYARYENLINYHYQYRKLANEIRLLELDIQDLNAERISSKRREVITSIKENEILFRKLQMHTIERNVEYACREIRSFLVCMDNVKPHMKYKDYESKEKEHWLRVYAIQKALGKSTCRIPRALLSQNKSLMDDELKKLTGAEK